MFKTIQENWINIANYYKGMMAFSCVQGKLLSDIQEILDQQELRKPNWIIIHQ